MLRGEERRGERWRVYMGESEKEKGCERERDSIMIIWSLFRESVCIVLVLYLG